MHVTRRAHHILLGLTDKKEMNILIHDEVNVHLVIVR